MNKNEVLILLTDQWCDWEASYAAAVIHSFSEYNVKTIAMDTKHKVSMGGIKTAVDFSIDDYNTFNNLAMLILPGGLSWENNTYDEIAKFVKTVRELNIPVAGICGAASFLCHHGFLNDVQHTGDSLELFKKEERYSGDNLYIQAQVVSDKGIITANETAAVEFAYEIFKVLKVDNTEEINQWFDNFQNGAVR
ncbi:type 1 glutamine amidotransferase family protein [Corticicoccus populi]|uniref:Type 1 glutamine amidotransferase family protein n=1 Tax=Corticicoccus populi TaxID=1812821 RepID=A0ABW5WTV3_9STAP